MKQPLISVIVPAYNAEKWLSECCDSVFEQTCSDWELVIVDDGSQDGTLALARGLAQNRENVQVIHTENGGVCCARNTGMDAAKGEYIAFLDADDLLVPDALERLLFLLKDHKADIAIGWKINMTPDAKDIGCPYEREYAIWDGTQALEQSLSDHPATYSVWGKLYKRQILENVRFIEGKRVHEDSFFLFQCLLKQPRVVLSEACVLRYRLSENSASRAPFSDKLFDILYFSEEKCRLIEKYYPEFLNLAGNVRVKANMALLRNMARTGTRYRMQEKACIRAVVANRANFRPAIKADRLWFWIIRCRMYYVYKVLLRIRSRMD